MASNQYLGKRAFAGQMARSGESGIIALSYINRDSKPIQGGLFVVSAENGGCKLISSAGDHLLGVVMVTGIHHEFKPERNLSVMTIGHGSEIWVQMSADSALAIGDPVKIIVSGEDAGRISDKGTLATAFYVSDVNGDLAKIMRSENVNTKSVAP